MFLPNKIIDGEYLGSVSTNILSLRTCPVARPPGGGLITYEISKKFIGQHYIPLLSN